MDFEEIVFQAAFYDEWCGTVFYYFETVPEVGHGQWAISKDGDVAYDLITDNITQTDFPDELVHLVQYIPDDIEIEGLEE